MKHVRRQGGNYYDFYKSNFSLLNRDRLIIETGIYHALEKRELEVYYQPRIDIEKRQINDFEKLFV
jgi:sensor c-di-GMP phosphodiesterase-like protein